MDHVKRHVLDELSQPILHPPRSRGNGACGSRTGPSEAMAYFQQSTTGMMFCLGFGMMMFLSFLRIRSPNSYRIVNVEGVMDIADDIYSRNLIH